MNDGLDEKVNAAVKGIEDFLRPKRAHGPWIWRKIRSWWICMGCHPRILLGRCWDCGEDAR